MNTFNATFESMEQPDYPASCDYCGKTGTNESMEKHLCLVVLKEEALTAKRLNAQLAANPATILELIAEVERLQEMDAALDAALERPVSQQ